MSVSAERIARWLWTVLRATIEAVRRFDAKGGWVLSSHVAMSMMLALSGRVSRASLT